MIQQQYDEYNIDNQNSHCITMRGKSSKVTECTMVNRGIATGSLKLYWIAEFRVKNWKEDRSYVLVGVSLPTRITVYGP